MDPTRRTAGNAVLGRVQGGSGCPCWLGPIALVPRCSRRASHRGGIAGWPVSARRASGEACQLSTTAGSCREAVRQQRLTSLTSEKASKNCLDPCAILLSTSFLSPPLLSARPIPSLFELEAEAVAGSSASNWPSVSNAALVAASCRLAESRRDTLRLRGLRFEEAEAEGREEVVARGESEGRRVVSILICRTVQRRDDSDLRMAGAKASYASTRRSFASLLPALHSSFVALNLPGYRNDGF